MYDPHAPTLFAVHHVSMEFLYRDRLGPFRLLAELIGKSLISMERSIPENQMPEFETFTVEITRSESSFSYKVETKVNTHTRQER
jgi:hypothetical protein